MTTKNSTWIYIALLLTSVLAVTPLSGAETDSFYRSLLERGITDLHAGHPGIALRELDIASFGLLDDTASYEVAQIGAALAAKTLGYKDKEAVAIRKVVSADNFEHVYPSLSLGDNRKLFEALMTAHGMSRELHELGRPVRATVPVPVAVAPTPAPVRPVPAPLPAVVQPQPVVHDPEPAVADSPAPAVSEAVEKHDDVTSVAIEGEWAVQLETLCQETSVQRLCAQDQSDVWLAPGSVGGKACCRVLRGHFATEAEAKKARAGMKPAQRKGTVVVRVTPSPGGKCQCG